MTTVVYDCQELLSSLVPGMCGHELTKGCLNHKCGAKPKQKGKDAFQTGFDRNKSLIAVSVH